jgi:hypothetical protein
MPTIISASEITVRYGDRAILDAPRSAFRKANASASSAATARARRRFCASSPACNRPTAAKFRGSAISS